MDTREDTAQRGSIKQKIKNFFTNKTIICCLVLTLVYLASGYNKWIEIAVPTLAFFAFLFLPVQEGFCLFVYLHCFGLSNLGWYSCLLGTVICYAVAMIVKYLVGLKRRKYKFYKAIFFVMLGFTAVSLFVSIFHRPLYTGALAYLAYLPLFYVIFAMRKEFNIHRAIKYLFVGLIASSLLSLAFAQLPHYQYDPIPSNRFRAFTNCTNYFYMRVFVVLTYFMFLTLTNKLGGFKFSLIYIVCATMILSTVSKTAICLLALFSLIFVVIYTAQNFKKRIKFVAVFAVVLLVVASLSYHAILNVIERFELVKDGDILNKLTTGRTRIWAEYLGAWLKNPATFLFGNGMLGAKRYIGNSSYQADTHSFLVMLLYRFGVVGILALGVVVFLMIKELNCRPKFAASLPLIWFIIESLADNTFQVNNIFMLILVCQILFCDSKEKTAAQPAPTAEN